jgi:hypothetical protein
LWEFFGRGEEQLLAKSKGVCVHANCLRLPVAHLYRVRILCGMTLQLRHATPFLFLRNQLLTLAGDLGNPLDGRDVSCVTR